ncbi:MAG: FAD-binding oxidoreductase [Candidatus Thermoplasmatota archaeon]|nr:FAD-binding oxidoreductase [Candidatus Thermoplasmatota archaeon]
MKIDIPKLKQIVGEGNVRDNIADLYVYASDASVHSKLPDVVVRPSSTKEVQEVVRYANKNKIPVVARGAGSGMSGQTVPLSGGIILDMKKMDKIIDIRSQDLLCKVQPGVINDELNRVLKSYGFFFPPTPSSGRICTIGGMIGTNASGNRSVKYGATRDAVLGMKVVLANGDLVTLGSNTKVDSSGYQLARLIVGSEGTLGIVVEATLRISPVPKYRAMGVANFATLRDAGNMISETIASGVTPSMLELMDNVAITAVNNAQNLGLPDVAAIVIFECNGMVKEAVDYEINQIKEISKSNHGTGIKVTDDPDEMVRIYNGRKKLFPSLSKYAEGLYTTALADDMAVPMSKIADTVQKIHEIAKKNNVVMSAYGHCGAGLIHTKILMDTTKKAQWQGAKRAVKEVYEYVQSMGGTTSGEHGIGFSKGQSFKEEKQDSLAMMKAIKKALDPNNILNPNKLMDSPDDWLTATPLRYQVSA